jgi:hypothetical protein
MSNSIAYANLYNQDKKALKDCLDNLQLKPDPSGEIFLIK